MFDKLLHFVAPHICCNCGNVGDILCEHCIDDIISEPFGRCVICFKLTLSATCQSCSIPHITSMSVVGERKDALKELIDLYKFERVQSADAILAQLLDQTLPHYERVVVTYVPASSSHRRQRGYDHVERVARRFAQLRSLPFQKLLSRNNDVEQRGLSRRERLISQRDAFDIVETDVKSPILLIDDIMTTGATLEAAAGTLAEYYESPIYAAIIARQTLDHTADL